MMAIFFICILAIAVIGTPLFVIMGGVGLYAHLLEEIPLLSFFIQLDRISAEPLLITIPLFTFGGYVMAESGAPARLIKLANAFCGWMPGGIALVCLVSCAFFTAFTGASGVTIVALGGLLYPVLIKEKYSEQFSLGLLTAGGSLGLLFPPSLPLILYGMIANTAENPVEIDKLFMAGIIPGILLILALGAYSIFKGTTLKKERSKFSTKEAWTALKEAMGEAPLPIIIIGGIYGGFFTTAEAAGVTALYVLLIEFFYYKDLSIKEDLVRVSSESMMLAGGIIIIMGTAMGLSNYFIDAEIPQSILEWMKGWIDSKVTFLIVMNIFLLIVGCLLDIFSAILVVVPILVPIAQEFGIDPYHMGIIFLTNLEIGYLTPPVGINLFISSYRFNKPVVTLYKAAIPFIIVLFSCLLAISYIPWLSTWWQN